MELNKKYYPECLNKTSKVYGYKATKKRFTMNIQVVVEIKKGHKRAEYNGGSTTRIIFLQTKYLA